MLSAIIKWLENRQTVIHERIVKQFGKSTSYEYGKDFDAVRKINKQLMKTL